MYVFRSYAFVQSDQMLEHGGIFVTNPRVLSLMGGSRNPAADTGAFGGPPSMAFGGPPRGPGFPTSRPPPAGTPLSLSGVVVVVMVFFGGGAVRRAGHPLTRLWV